MLADGRAGQLHPGGDGGGMMVLCVGLPGAADDLAHMVYTKVKSLHPSLPSLADECPEWEWYEES
jgi:hypothetical protein